MHTVLILDALPHYRQCVLRVRGSRHKFLARLGSLPTGNNLNRGSGSGRSGAVGGTLALSQLSECRRVINFYLISHFCLWSGWNSAITLKVATTPTTWNIMMLLTLTRLTPYEDDDEWSLRLLLGVHTTRSSQSGNVKTMR